MKMRIFISLALLGLITSACGGAGQSGQESNDSAQDSSAEQWEDIMAVHDEVMPKMSDMNRISRELREYAEQHPDMPAERREKIESTVRELSEAEEGMWEWMNQAPQQYKKLREEGSGEALDQFLEEQQAVIDKVRKNILQAIEDGEKLLSELQSGQKEQ